MPNIRLEIEYDGTHYCGWQIQRRNKQKRSIQELLAKTLQKILQQKIQVTGSGRTDSGVHALAQIANFKTGSRINLKTLQKSLNSLLPGDIVVRKISAVPQDFHACYSAKSKTYRYLILNSRFPSPFWDRFSWHIPYDLDIGLMRKEARVLLGRHDFRAFCASGSNAHDTVRVIKRITISVLPYSLAQQRLNWEPVIWSCRPEGKRFKQSAFIIIDIEADGFLYNMVRNIVGTLVEIGRHRFKRGDLKRILAAKDRKLAGQAAAAKGLFLIGVKY